MAMVNEEALKIMSVDSIRLLELARSIKTWQQVLTTSINEANMTNDFVRLRMDYDKGTFSRILSGQANMCPGRLKQFNEVVGHDLTLYWLSDQGGYELRKIPKTLEEELKKERAEKEEALKRVAILEELLLKKKEIDSNN